MGVRDGGRVSATGSEGPPAPAVSRWSVRGWAVWALPTHVLGPVLLVEATAVCLVLLQFVALGPASVASVLPALVLVAVGVVHTEIALGVERIRRRVSDGNYVDLTSVWTFAGAVLLPGPHAAVVAVLISGHLWARAWRPRTPLFRHAFTTSTIALSCLAAAAVMESVTGGPLTVTQGHGEPQLVGLVLAILVYTTVNSCLVAGAIAVSSPRFEPSKVFASWEENVLEIATLCLGALAAVAVVIHPLMVVYILPPLLVLHRAVLVRHLEQAASTDGKTGLLNAAAWHTQAERELRRAERREGPRAVLVVDLDHFKDVNDNHGHLAGDQVLAAVADALRREVRDRDLVGRFGGEEFVVLIGGLGEPAEAELEAVAERVRGRIAALRVEIPTPDGPLTVAGLSASVGGALYPGDGRDLRTLLHVADTALYAAKRAGRNAVRLGLQVPNPVEAGAGASRAAADIGHTP